MRRVILFPAVFALLAACDGYSLIGPGRDFEGFYTYAGTVENRVGHVIVGNLRIDRRGGRYEVDIDWEYLDQGESIVRIVSDTPALADVDGFGNVAFDFEGTLFLDGGSVFFRLEHVGVLEHRTIHGDWRLVTGLPTTDRGTFIADR